MRFVEKSELFRKLSKSAPRLEAGTSWSALTYYYKCTEKKVETLAGLPIQRMEETWKMHDSSLDFSIGAMV